MIATYKKILELHFPLVEKQFNYIIYQGKGKDSGSKGNGRTERDFL